MGQFPIRGGCHPSPSYKYRMVTGESLPPLLFFLGIRFSGVENVAFIPIPVRHHWPENPKRKGVQFKKRADQAQPGPPI